MAQLILYQGTPNTPIETYEIDEEENVLVDLDGDEPTNGYHGKLIHFITQCGWNYHGNKVMYMNEWEGLKRADPQCYAYTFEHPTHGTATIFIDEDQGGLGHAYILGPASEQLGTALTAYGNEDE